MSRSVRCGNQLLVEVLMIGTLIFFSGRGLPSQHKTSLAWAPDQAVQPFPLAQFQAPTAKLGVAWLPASWGDPNLLHQISPWDVLFAKQNACGVRGVLVCSEVAVLSIYHTPATCDMHHSTKPMIYQTPVSSNRDAFGMLHSTENT